MAWLQLHVDTDRAFVPTLEAALTNAGACSVTLSDGGDTPILEPDPDATPLWTSVRVTGLFEEQPLEPLLARIRRSLSGAALPPWEVERLDDRDWSRAWLADFRPLCFGRRLCICPSTQTPPPDRRVVRLDPGLAFGTGTHPTTALCLAWLDNLDLRGQTVLDVGCGSGVLALAALALGAAHAIGVDHDPQALTASRQNAERNAITGDAFALYRPDTLPDTARAAVVVANILAGPLQTLAPVLAAHAEPGARFCLSGILTDQADAVRRAYTPYGDLEPTVTSGEWVRLTGRFAR